MNRRSPSTFASSTLSESVTKIAKLASPISAYRTKSGRNASAPESPSAAKKPTEAAASEPSAPAKFAAVL